MNMDSETELLNEICRKARRSGRITDKQRDQLNDLFGSKFDHALEVVEQNRVKLYIFDPSSRRVWIVVGKSRDYQILPRAEFCTCNDYYFRVIGGKTPLCYHLIAQKLAEALDKFDLVTENDEMYDALMKEWRGND